MKEWQPIETAPKTLKEIVEIYGYGRICISVLISRADIAIENGVIAGAVAECSLIHGEWKYPLDPEFAKMTGEVYGEITNATHWKPMPDLPKASP